MQIHDLFHAIAYEDPQALLHAPTLSAPEKAFVEGYIAYEARQYRRAYEIFKQLHEAGHYLEESFYAAARCLVDGGATEEALQVLFDGNVGNKFGRYFCSFFRANGREAAAQRIESEVTQFFESYMAEQTESSAHGFLKYEFPDDSVLEQFFKPVFDQPESFTTALDVGCNHGVMLDFLRRKSLAKSFAGVEINQAAVVEFERKFPETYSATFLYHGTADQQLSRFADQSMDLVFSHTVMTAIPNDNVIREMARVAGKYVYFAESDNRNKCLLPNGNIFHDYEGIMDSCGFELVYKDAPPDKGRRYYAVKVYRVFKRKTAAA